MALLPWDLAVDREWRSKGGAVHCVPRLAAARVTPCRYPIRHRPLEVTMFRSFARSARSLTLAALGSLLMCSGVNRAHGQIPVSYVADIPFAFHMNSQTLPAGKYRITPVTSPQGLRLNEIGGKNGGFVLVYPGDDARNVGSAVIRFNRYGNANFLRDFSTEALGPELRSVSRCSVTTAEKRAQKD